MTDAPLDPGTFVLVAAPGCVHHGGIVFLGAVVGFGPDAVGSPSYFVQSLDDGRVWPVLPWAVTPLAAIGMPEPGQIAREVGRG